MTFDLFMVWSNLCPSCCGNAGRLLHDICKYAGKRIVALWPLFIVTVFIAIHVLVRSSASYLGLHCLPRSFLWDARHILIKIKSVCSGHG